MRSVTSAVRGKTGPGCRRRRVLVRPRTRSGLGAPSGPLRTSRGGRRPYVQVQFAGSRTLRTGDRGEEGPAVGRRRPAGRGRHQPLPGGGGPARVWVDLHAGDGEAPRASGERQRELQRAMSSARLGGGQRQRQGDQAERAHGHRGDPHPPHFGRDATGAVASGTG